MAFNTPATAGEITRTRTMGQAFDVFIAAPAISIVWQAEVDDTKTAADYAEFEWANASGSYGAYTDVIEGQTCLVTATATDFKNPVIRGRVRKVPGATTFYIDETGNDIDSSMFITVIDDFAPFAKKPRVDFQTNEQFKDWDIVYRPLPPMITGLASTYLDYSGDATVTWSFAPAPVAVNSGATIASHLWDVGDGSITVGTTTTENITAQFPGAVTNEWRWVHYTVTDSNGIAQAFHFRVFTVNEQSSSVMKLNTGGYTINTDWETGYTAEFTAWDGFDANSVLAKSRITIFAHPYYNTLNTVDQTPIGTIILFTGWLDGESEAFDVDAATRVDRVSLSANGFGTEMLAMPADNLPIFDVDSPSTWGQITAPTLTHVAVYFLAYHTTFMSLASFQFDDFSAYRASGDTLSLTDTKASTTINDIADTVNALLSYAPDGFIAIRRNAVYLDTSDRNALDTIYDFDIDEADIALRDAPLTYELDFEMVKMAGASYDTAVKENAFILEGISPNANFGQGYDQDIKPNQVLLADVDFDTAAAELGQRTGNRYADINPKPTYDVTLRGGFYWIVPTSFQWWTFDVPIDYSVRGRVYASSQRWLLRSTTMSIDAATSTIDLSAVFTIETVAGNAGISVTQRLLSGEAVYEYSPSSPYDTFPDDPNGLGESSFGISASQENYPPGYNQDAPIGTDQLQIQAHGGVSRSTHNATSIGESYIIQIAGEAKLDNKWRHVIDYVVTDGGFVLTPIPAVPDLGVWTDGTGWEDTDSIAGDAVRGISINLDIASTALTQLALTYDAVKGIDDPGGSPITSPRLFLRTGGISGSVVYDSGNRTDWGIRETITFNFPGGTTADNIAWTTITDQRSNPADPMTGDATYYTLVLEGNGDNPFGGGSEDGTQGDSFYYGYNTGSPTLYDPTDGIRIDGNKPSVIPSFQTNHVYQFVVAGTGAPLNFSFDDFSGANLPQSNFTITVTGEGMSIYA